MADLKISALTGASTPLAGTEVLPIVQSGSTKKVSVADLTAGRAVATAGGSFTDNITQGTAAKGINFTANTATAGMTSQLLNWYEEGTWTPAVSAGAGTITSYTSTGKYTRIGRQVTLNWDITITNNGTGSALLYTTGMPFSAPANAVVNYFNITTAVSGSGKFSSNTIYMVTYSGAYPVATGDTITCTVTYFV